MRSPCGTLLRMVLLTTHLFQALGLASVLLSSLILHRFKHLLRMRLGVDLLGGKDVGDGARFVGYEGGAKGAHVLASAH